MNTYQTRLQTCIAVIAFGLFGVVYILKDITSFNIWISIFSLTASALAYLYSLKLLKSGIVLSTGFLLFTTFIVRIGVIPLPIFVDDIFYRTLWDGWLQTNNINPYLLLPSSEELELLKSRELYDLVFRQGHFTSSSPLFEVIYRFTAIIYDQFGLAYGILAHKIISAIIDLALIYSLVLLSDIKNLSINSIAVVAWNPFLILFFTSQGLFLQLAGLTLIWFFYLYHQKNIALSSMVWGMVMLTSPIGWIGFPMLLLRIFSGRNRWIFAGLSLGTYLAWWIPFLSLRAVRNYLFGITGFWVDGISHLSAGYGILQMIPDVPVNLSLIGLLITALGFMFAVGYLLTNKDVGKIHKFSHYLYLLGAGLFFLSPSILLSLIPALFILAVFKDSHINLSAVVSVILLLNFIFWQLSAFVAAILFILLLAGLFLLNHYAGWVRVNIDTKPD